MPRYVITVDGDRILDKDLNQYQRQDPDVMRKFLKPGAQQDPWSMAVLAVFIKAMTDGLPVGINITTAPDGQWDMHVDPTPTKALTG